MKRIFYRLILPTAAILLLTKCANSGTEGGTTEDIRKNDPGTADTAAPAPTDHAKPVAATMDPAVVRFPEASKDDRPVAPPESPEKEDPAPLTNDTIKSVPSYGPAIFGVADTDSPPLFPMAYGTLSSWIKENFVFPVKCEDATFPRSVTLTFVVETDGRLSRIAAENPARECPEFAANAENLLAGSPKWSPGIKNGKAVRTRMTHTFNGSYD